MARHFLTRRLAAGTAVLLLTVTSCTQAAPTATTVPPTPTRAAPTATTAAPTVTTAATATRPASTPTAAVTPTVGAVTGTPAASCLPVPAPTATAGPAPTAAPPGMPTPVANASASDGIYTPVTYREVYQKISTDYQEIVQLTNQVNEGKPMPSAEILAIYEKAKNAIVGTTARPMRAFALDPATTRRFADEVAFFCSQTWLDDWVMDGINGTGVAAKWTPAQRRQAIQKGLINIMHHYSRNYLDRGPVELRPGLVDEGWAIYVGFPTADGKYPNALRAIAESREANFNRPGTIDAPLRQAMARAQKAAADQNAAAYDAAKKEVHSRFYAIFYLSTARYFNEAAKSITAGNVTAAQNQQVEGLSYYRPIQVVVAKADAAADKTIVAFYTADPATLTPQKRDEALAALNKTSSALLLQPADLVNSF